MIPTIRTRYLTSQVAVDSYSVRLPAEAVIALEQPLSLPQPSQSWVNSGIDCFEQLNPPNKLLVSVYM